MGAETKEGSKRFWRRSGLRSAIFTCGKVFDQLTTQGNADLQKRAVEIAMSDVPTGYNMYNEVQARDKDLFNGDMHLVMVDAV